MHRPAAALALAAFSGLVAPSQQARPSPPELLNVKLPELGTTMPKVIDRTLPVFPVDAVNARVREVSELEVVVGRNGTVIDVRVTKPLASTFGLDDAAVAAVRTWTFEPAVAEQKRVVPCLVLVQVAFDAKSGKPEISANVVNVPNRPEISRDHFNDPDVFQPGNAGVRPPTMLRRIEPSYTGEAMRAKIQGDVEMDAVIDAHGVVQSALVARSLDDRFGLDAQALRAASYWLFNPGTRDGQPVATRVTFIMSFRLH